MGKPGGPNPGVVVGIVTEVTDAGGNPIVCSSDRECLKRWLWYWNTSGAPVIQTAATILVRAVPGIEYTLDNFSPGFPCGLLDSDHGRGPILDDTL